MVRRIAALALLISASEILAQSTSPSPAAPRPKFDSFEVATIKPMEPDAKSGRYITMQGNNRFIEKAYTLKLLIAAAYDLNPRAISGGPPWIESDHYDILALTPGDVRPTRDEQMSMLRNLVTDRFQLTFHREPKVFSIYELQVAKSGSKLKETVVPNNPPTVGPGVVYPQRIVLPAHNATTGDLASLLQRAIWTGQSWIRPDFQHGTTSISSGHPTKLNLAEMSPQRPRTPQPLHSFRLSRSN